MSQRSAHRFADRLVDRVDRFIHRLLMRIAPVWYARQSIDRLPFPDMRPINGASAHAEEWLTLAPTLDHTATALQQQEGLWAALGKEVSHLLVYKSLPRPVSLTRLGGSLGLGSSAHPSLREWCHAYMATKSATPASAHAAVQLNLDAGDAEDSDASHMNVEDINANDSPDTDTPIADSDEFDARLRAVRQPLKVTYREWDGRYFATDAKALMPLMPLLHFAMIQQRDAAVPATLTIEAVKSAPLERIREHLWWFLISAEAARSLVSLLQQCGFPVTMVEGLPGRPDLAFVFASKRQVALNRVVLHLMSTHRSTQLTEFGRFLSQHRAPYRR